MAKGEDRSIERSLSPTTLELFEGPQPVAPNRRLARYQIVEPDTEGSRVYRVGYDVITKANAMTAMLMGCDFSHAFINEFWDEWEGCEIAVIGAGVVGLTITHNLIRAGAKVTLIEKNPVPLLRWNAADHRFIHPGYCEWPRPGWEKEESTEVYGMNNVVGDRLEWRAGNADDVRRQLIDRFEAGIGSSFDQPTDLYTPRFGCTLHNADADDEIVKVSINDDAAPLRCGWIIECPGLGQEVLGDGCVSYWDRNAPTQPHLYIAGRGDGAVVDAMKHLVNRAGEPWLYQVLKDWEGEEKREVQDMVASRLPALHGTHGRKYSDFYREIAQSLEHLPRLIAPLLTPGREVTIAHRGSSFLNPRITPLNLVLFEAMRKCRPQPIHFLHETNGNPKKRVLEGEEKRHIRKDLVEINRKIRVGSVGFLFRGGTERTSSMRGNMLGAHWPDESPYVPTFRKE